jgi:hypothetical protein
MRSTFVAEQVDVILADLPKKYDSTEADAIKAALQGFFDSTIAKHKLDAAVKVAWAASAPSIGARDLVCYFVRNVGDTIVAGNVVKDVTPPAGNWGITLFWGKLVGSEVYQNRPKKAGHAARLALHELMHNMALAGNGMHQPGMSIGADPVMEGAVLSDADMKWIAAHLLKTERTQWGEGWARYNDPLRGAL